MLVFEERRKPKDLEKNLLEQRRELTNSAHKSMLEFEAARPDWWEASTLTTAPALLPKPCARGNSRAWRQLHGLARYDWLIWLSKSFVIGYKNNLSLTCGT